MWLRWLKQRDTWAFIGIALLVRGCLFGMFLRGHGLHSAWYGWGAETGDTPGYFEPVESFLRGAAYLPDYRMPGYGIPYLLFRSFTTPQGAGSAIILLQALLGMVSVVVLARCAKLLGAQRWVQYAVCLGYAAFARVVVYDVYWLTESLCTSALILGTHGWLAHGRTASRGALFWSGLWLAWAVFLRPVQLVWLLLLGVGILFTRTASVRQKVGACALFLLPFAIADGWWVRRNAIMHREFVPLSRGVVMPELATSPMYPLMRFLQATGGNYIHWDPSAHIRWFNMREGPLGRPGPRVDQGVVMPSFALCDRITEDSLRAWASDMSRWSDSRTTPQERMDLFRSMNARSDRFVHFYEEDRPWQYMVASRARLTSLYFGLAGSGALFRSPAKREEWFVPSRFLLDAPMHWTVLIGGLIGALLALRHTKRSRPVAWIGALTLVSVFIVPWGLRLCEGRYLLPMYPWLFMLLMLAVGGIPAARSRPAAHPKRVPLVDQ